MPPIVDDPTRRLVELIQAGIDPEGNFEKLYKLHERRVVSFFLHKDLSREEARDLTQDVFLRVFKGIKTFRLEAQLKTWLFEIADHVYLNELRRRGTGKRKGWEISLESGGQSEEGEPAPFEPPPSAPRALEDVLEQERMEALSRAIQELPEQMRTCFLLRYQQGRQYKEIAVLMKISIETVKAHLHQAKKRLKLELQDDPD